MITIFGKFIWLFIASLVLGVAAGLGSALLLKRFNVKSAPQVRTRVCMRVRVCACARVRVRACVL